MSAVHCFPIISVIKKVEVAVGLAVVGVVEYSWFRKICTARGLSVEARDTNNKHYTCIPMYAHTANVHTVVYTLFWHGYQYTSLTVLCAAVTGM